MHTSIAPPPAGIYPPLVTYFHEDESLDLETITTHVLRQARGGVAGVVVQGSNGEAVHLDSEERSTIVRHVRGVLNDNGFEKLALIVGAGAASRRETLKLIREAKEAGGDYVMILSPSYWAAAMNTSTVINYFETLADEAALPILIYNFPMVANGINVDSDSMIRLAGHRNIVGCKLTCGNLGNLHRICAHTDTKDFVTMCGKAESTLHGLVGGASGSISALVNLAPKAHVALYQAWLAGDLVKAKKLQDVLADADLAQTRLGVVTGMKLAVSHYFGYGNGRGRSPLLPGKQALIEQNSVALDRLVDLEKSL